MNNLFALSQFSNDEAMAVIGNLIDAATEERNIDQAKQALLLCDEMDARLSGEKTVELYYFKANAWSAIRLANHQDQSCIWQWDQTELLNEVYWLRSAIQHESFKSTDLFRQCQILVNTGNIFSHIGRPVEAIEYWQRALIKIPNFAMALINLGNGLESYAKMLYDKGHACVLLNDAYKSYSSVTNKNLVWDSGDYKEISKVAFKRARDIKQHLDLEKIDKLLLDKYSLGRSRTEKIYRKWVLDNKLFINPLNDLGSLSIAAQDVMHLPNMQTNSEGAPYHFGFYNQLKQEYATARFLLWQGIRESDQYQKHFSDKDLMLINTLDYPRYGLAIEKIKLSFRSAYSLLDKVAFFINDYWNLKVPERQVSFYRVWYSEKKQLNPQLTNLKNLSLRGLFWLSKDFIDEGSNDSLILGQTMEPDASRLAALRNHLEHKYVKVHDDFFMPKQDNSESFFSDNLAHHISTQELCEKAIRILKLTRGALIYLSLAVHEEEKRKDADGSVLAIPIVLPTID